MPSLHGGSLEIKLQVPLKELIVIKFKYFNYAGEQEQLCGKCQEIFFLTLPGFGSKSFVKPENSRISFMENAQRINRVQER